MCLVCDVRRVNRQNTSLQTQKGLCHLYKLQKQTRPLKRTAQRLPYPRTDWVIGGSVPICLSVLNQNSWTTTEWKCCSVWVHAVWERINQQLASNWSSGNIRHELVVSYLCKFELAKAIRQDEGGWCVPCNWSSSAGPKTRLSSCRVLYQSWTL